LRVWEAKRRLRHRSSWNRFGKASRNISTAFMVMIAVVVKIFTAFMVTLWLVVMPRLVSGLVSIVVVPSILGRFRAGEAGISRSSRWSRWRSR